MAAYQDVQSSFLELIKDNLPKSISLADEMADLLHISKDSAYRRLRGETTLGLDEIQKLASHFGVSIDTLLSKNQNTVSFQYRCIDGVSLTFLGYLESILDNLRMINTFEVKQLFYLAKDIPIFHHFQFPLLGEFKCFFWLKTILNDAELTDVGFTFGKISESYVATGHKIWKAYLSTPSLEVWSYETINITLRQIEFYYDCGLFENKADALKLVDQVEMLISHIKKQAELGRKFDLNSDLEGPENNFQLYSNEVNIADNTIFFKMGNSKITFITHNNLNILSTSNPDFCDSTDGYIQNLIRKSSLISQSSEKERTKFFHRLQKKVEKLRAIIE